MSSRAVTLWFRFSHEAAWQFNHLEDGHIHAVFPASKAPEQTGWARQQWQASHAWLSYDVPPRVVYYDPDREN